MNKLFVIVLFLLVSTFTGVIGLKMVKKDKHTAIKKEIVIEYKEKLVPIRDTITRVEFRLQKAKEIHDTIEIIKQQDTLIKFLKVEVKVQDTIIKFQDTIIIDCENNVKKEKRNKRIAILGATILAIGLIIK